MSRRERPSPSPPTPPPPPDRDPWPGEGSHDDGVEGGPLQVELRTGGRIGGVLCVVALLGVGLLFGITGVARMLRAPPAVLTGAILVLPWLYVGATALLFGLWSAVPDRWSPPALLTVVVGGAGLLWGPGWASRNDVSTIGESVRVMSWNVRRLWGHPEAEADALGCVAETIEREEPDVVTFLEVSRVDVTRLEQRLSMHCVHTPYHGGTDPRVGGIASCVRGAQWQLEGGTPARFVDNVDWYYVFTEVSRGDSVFNVLAVHLFPYGPLEKVSQVTRAQGQQSAALLARVDKFRDPTVLAGDFNSTRDAQLHVSLRKRLIDAYEHGAQGFGATIDLGGFLPLRIDYIYATAAWAVRDARVPDVRCSDHRPVVADLILPEAGSGTIADRE